MSGKVRDMHHSSLSETRREYIHVGSMPASLGNCSMRCSTSCIHAVVRARVSVREE
ncbi:MAG: hypothetical protein GXP22_10375 [Gammaproteobacteria bacterium]|nr:hypothetical protein [Gammaproteobacteria bacterium]